MNQLKHSAITLLEDLKEVLQQIEQDEYNQPIEALCNGTIGQHTRHVIEFYQCFINQLDQKVINYTLRQRDVELENIRSSAVAAIGDVIIDLYHLKQDVDLVLATDKEENVKIESNLSRELYHNIEHTIHHMAILKIGLFLIAPEVVLPEHFGLAPSTVKHRASISNETVEIGRYSEKYY